jgi:hypothetical protein
VNPLDLIMWSLAGAASIVVIGIAIAIAIVALARAVCVVKTGFAPNPRNEIGRGMATMADTLSSGVAGASRSLVDRLDSQALK